MEATNDASKIEEATSTDHAALIEEITDTDEVTDTGDLTDTDENTDTGENTDAGEDKAAGEDEATGEDKAEVISGTKTSGTATVVTKEERCLSKGAQSVLIYMHLALVYVAPAGFCLGTLWYCEDWWEERTLMLYICYALFLAMRLICHLFLEAIFEHGNAKFEAFVYLSLHEIGDYLVLMIVYAQTVEIEENRAIPLTFYLVVCIAPFSMAFGLVKAYLTPVLPEQCGPAFSDGIAIAAAILTVFSALGFLLPLAISLLFTSDGDWIFCFRVPDAMIAMLFFFLQLIDPNLISSNPTIAGWLAVKIIWIGNLILTLQFDFSFIFAGLDWPLLLSFAPFCLISHAIAIQPKWWRYQKAIEDEDRKREATNTV